jgi:hypothetical protein
MLNPPTDRLHKFAAIAGLALLIVGITIPVQKYQEAEVQRIEAIAKMQEVRYAYERYASQVNQMIDMRNDAVTRGLKDSELEAVKGKIRALDPEAEKLGKETERVIVEMIKHTELAAHLGFVQNLWFAISFFGALGGSVLAFFGFRQWFRQPKNER